MGGTVLRPTGGSMYYMVFHAVPQPHRSKSNGFGGAFIGCWINRPTLSEADRIAREWIASEEWQVSNREEAYPVDRSMYGDDNASLKYYEQAIIDREVFVFHTYPAAPWLVAPPNYPESSCST
jgi:hypothetical protein